VRAPLRGARLRLLALAALAGLVTACGTGVRRNPNPHGPDAAPAPISPDTADAGDGEETARDPAPAGEVGAPVTGELDGGSEDAAFADAAACEDDCPRCGDGVRQAGEACDDGNDIEDDECTPACATPRCGDGITQPGELCDPGNDTGNHRCTAQCTWVPFRQIVAGANHMCGVRSNGSVTCWGAGAGAAAPSPGAFSELAAGLDFTCGSRSDGQLACWGKSIGTPPAGPLRGLVAGDTFACGLRDDGSPLCWSASPVVAPQLPDGKYARLAAAAEVVCGIVEDGRLACAGYPSTLVEGRPTGPFTDVALGPRGGCATHGASVVSCWGGLSSPSVPVRNISIGTRFACGVTAVGQPHCWPGPIGDDVPVPGDYTQIVLNRLKACGLRTDGTVVCWGTPWPLRDVSPTPQRVRDLSCLDHVCTIDRTGISCGSDRPGPPPGVYRRIAHGSHSCALASHGVITCWGGEPDDQAAIAAPPGTWKDVVVGLRHSCALGREGRDGEPSCWGDQSRQQLLPLPGPFERLAAGDYHTCGLSRAGTAACWGGGYFDAQPPPAGPFVELAARGDTTCGVRDDGSVACWGPSALAKVPPPAGLRRLSVGIERACGLTAAGTIQCWGEGGTPALDGVFEQVAACTRFVCGRWRDGSLACGGDYVLNRDNRP